MESEGSGETTERQGCPQGRGEVLAGPFAVSERSKRRRNLSAALTPDGLVHHLENSQPHPREGHRTPPVPAGQLSWLASCPPPMAGRHHRPLSVGRWPWAGTRQGAGDSSGTQSASLCPGGRRIAPATEDLASHRWRRRALPCVIGASDWYRFQPGARPATSKADPLGGGQKLTSSPTASDVVSSTTAAPRPRCSGRATRAGCRSDSHQKNWGAKRRRGHHVLQ